MGESPLVTNAVARDLVRGGQHDNLINSAWSGGSDTRSIASELGVHEAEIANRLPALRTDSQWDDEAVATLRRMWTEGRSATEISRELRFPTRSAVLGKVHRLGLEPRKPTTARVPKPVRAKAQADTDRRLTQTLFRRAAAQRQRERATERKRVQALAPLNLALVDMERNQCRFATTDDAPFLFCGKPTVAGTSWCAHCYTLVYAPRQRRPAGRVWHDWGLAT